MIYFDNAATTGVKPQQVIYAVNKGLKKYSANPGRSGHKAAVEAATAVYSVRQQLSDFFGADGPENVVFTLNCTHSINCVLKGVLRRGDHILVSSLEHNAVMRPLAKMGVSYSVFNVSFTDDAETVRSLKEKLRPNTRMVFCTGASNVWGKLLPIEAIGKVCSEKKMLFGVDAAQIAGVIPIDMKKMNIDYLCIAPHKGLYAPMGTGVLICRRGLAETLIEGGTGTNSVELKQPEELPERLESGTVSLPAVMGIGAGLDYIKRLGTERVYSHESGLIKELYHGLKSINGIILYTPEPLMGFYAPVLSFNIEDYPSETVAEWLSENGVCVRGGLHCAPMAHRVMGTLESGAVRLSVATFNNREEVISFLKLIKTKKITKNLKKAIE